MATKRWTLVVTELGASAPLSEVTVEADNWMSALRTGRQELSEEPQVPTGSSCAVAPDGKVTILDPVERRRYIVTPDTSPEFKEAASKVPAAKPPAAEAKKDEEPKPKRRRTQSKTVAYIQSPLAQGPGGAVSIPGASAAPAAAKAAPAAAKAAPAAAKAAPAAAAKAAPAAAAEPKPGKAKPDLGEPTAAPSWEILSSRDEDPTEENPLRYRERTYVVPEGTSKAVAQAVIEARFEDMVDELKDAPDGKFVNLAIFDHAWTDRPQRAPLVTLQWKDWRGDPEIEFPVTRKSQRPPAPAASHPPSVAAAAAREDSIASVPVSTTGEHDLRLAQAFEACQDLLFLGTPAEGLDFAVKLVGDLIPCEAISACLYDINTDEFRFVAVTGQGAEQKKSEAVPFSAGVLGIAAKRIGAPLLVPDLTKHPTYDPGVDGRVDLDARNAMYLSLAHQGQLLGVIQLLNRKRKMFTQPDGDLLVYIGGQLSEFLHKARLKPRK